MNPEIKVGDLVKHASGGPVMKVLRLIEQPMSGVEAEPCDGSPMVGKGFYPKNWLIKVQDGETEEKSS